MNITKPKVSSLSFGYIDSAEHANVLRLIHLLLLVAVGYASVINASNAMSYDKQSKWDITTTVINTPGMPGDTYGYGVSLSDDGNHHAYSMIKTREGPIGPYELYSSSKESMEAEGIGDKRHFFQWRVDGKDLKLCINNYILRNFFIDENINGVNVTEIYGVRMNHPGKFVFSREGKDWLLAVECTIYLGNSRFAKGTSVDAFLFWVNGSFKGLEFKPEGSMQSILFAPRNKHFAIFYSNDDRSYYSDNSNNTNRTSVTIISYSDVFRTESVKSFIPGSEGTTRVRLGVKTVFSGNYLAGDIRIRNNNLEWAVVTDTVYFKHVHPMITRETTGEPLRKFMLVSKQGDIPLKNSVSRLWYGKNGYLIKSGTGELLFNGIPQKRFQEIVNAALSPNGKHYIAIVKENETTFALVDNKAKQLHDELSQPIILSIDDEEKWRAIGSVLVENGDTLGNYIWRSNVVYNKTNSSYAFLGLKEDLLKGSVGGVLSTFLVSDGKEKPIDMGVRLADGVFGIISDGMGSQIALNPEKEVVLSCNPPSLENLRQRRQKETYVRKNGVPVGGKKYILHPEVEPVLSDDGENVFIVGRSAGEWKLFVNGHELAGFDEIGIDNSRLSLNSSGVLIFFAEQGGNNLLVQVSPTSSPSQ